MDARLVVTGGKANRKEITLKLPLVIGRGGDVGLTVAHPTVSRKHCELREIDGNLVVIDKGSRNGTFVDDQRVKGKSVLRPGGTLTVGPLTFRAEYEQGVPVGDATQIPADTTLASAAQTGELPDLATTGGDDDFDFGMFEEVKTTGTPGKTAKPAAANKETKKKAPEPDQTAEFSAKPKKDDDVDFDDVDFDAKPARAKTPLTKSTKPAPAKDDDVDFDFDDLDDSPKAAAAAEPAEATSEDDAADFLSDAAPAAASKPAKSAPAADEVAEDEFAPEAAEAEDDAAFDFLGNADEQPAAATEEPVSDFEPVEEQAASEEWVDEPPEAPADEPEEDDAAAFDEPAAQADDEAAFDFLSDTAESPVKPKLEPPVAAASDDDEDVFNFIGENESSAAAEADDEVAAEDEGDAFDFLAGPKEPAAATSAPEEATDHDAFDFDSKEAADDADDGESEPIAFEEPIEDEAIEDEAAEEAPAAEEPIAFGELESATPVASAADEDDNFDFLPGGQSAAASEEVADELEEVDALDEVDAMDEVDALEEADEYAAEAMTDFDDPDRAEAGDCIYTPPVEDIGEHDKVDLNELPALEPSAKAPPPMPKPAPGKPEKKQGGWWPFGKKGKSKPAASAPVISTAVEPPFAAPSQSETSGADMFDFVEPMSDEAEEDEIELIERPGAPVDAAEPDLVDEFTAEDSAESSDFDEVDELADFAAEEVAAGPVQTEQPLDEEDAAFDPIDEGDFDTSEEEETIDVKASDLQGKKKDEAPADEALDDFFRDLGMK